MNLDKISYTDSSSMAIGSVRQLVATTRNFGQDEHMQTLNLVICASSEGLLARLLAELSSMPSVYRIERFPSPANSTSYSATSPPQLQPPTPHPSAATEYAERTPNAVAFAHAARRFLVQHSEQPERAMRALVAGVAGLDVAILVVSGSAELDTRTRTLAYLSGQLGVRHVVFGVDLTGLGADCKKRFIEIADACNALATQCGLVASVTVPLFTDRDTNVLIPCALVPDYQGTSLHAHLQGLALGHRALASLPLRICVQTVEPSDDAHLTVTGTVLTGHARVGERVRVQPGGYELAIENVIPQSANDRTDSRDESVAITLRGQAAIAHGSVISSIESPAQVADQFQATVVWMGQAPLLRGRSYILRTPADAVQATVAPLKYMINPRTFEHVAAERLECWEVGVCELELDRPVVFDPFAENPCTGSFTLADPITHEEVGAGILQFALRRAHNVHIHGLAISRYMRAHQKTQKPCILWLTGLSGSGKSTIANEIDKQLHAMGRHAYILDGDNVRHGLTKDLGFTAQDRVENIRRIAEVAKLMADAGLIVLTAFISPFRSERHMARNLMLPGEFIEIFVDTPLALAESRDPKGLYKKARRGEIKNFTGLDSPYEAPDAPEIRLHTASLSPQEAANQVIEYLRHAGSFDAP